MSQRLGGRTVNHYWDISPQISTLIRNGEQEHLDDALRAYQLTYQCVETAVNSLVGRQFGPANTPAEATELARQALAQILPRQLGTDPANWVRMLARLLTRTQARDSSGWHALDIGPPRTRGNMILHPVTTTTRTRIGRVPSAQVVNY